MQLIKRCLHTCDLEAGLITSSYLAIVTMTHVLQLIKVRIIKINLEWNLFVGSEPLLCKGG